LGLEALLAEFPRIRLATAADNDALLAFFARQSMPLGPMRIAYDRAPDFFALLRCRGDESYVFVDGGAEIRGIGSLTLRDGYIDSERRRVGYLADLRVTRARDAVEWRRFYAALLLHFRDVPMMTAVLDANAAARNALTAAREEFVYEPLSRYRMVNVFARAPRLRRRFVVRRATRDDLPLLASFLDARNRGKPFGVPCTVADLESRFARWPNFSIERFVLAFADDALVGACADWSPHAVERIVVRRGPLRVTPRINYLTHLSCDESVFADLVAAPRPRAWMLTYADFRLRPLHVRGVQQSVAATLYTVRHRDAPRVVGEAAVAGFEIALV
jgi:hypothetical protein